MNIIIIIIIIIIITLNSMFPCKVSRDNERSTMLSRIDRKKLSIEKQGEGEGRGVPRRPVN